MRECCPHAQAVASDLLTDRITFDLAPCHESLFSWHWNPLNNNFTVYTRRTRLKIRVPNTRTLLVEPSDTELYFFHRISTRKLRKILCSTYFVNFINTSDIYCHFRELTPSNCNYRSWLRKSTSYKYISYKTKAKLHSMYLHSYRKCIANC